MNFFQNKILVFGKYVITGAVAAIVELYILYLLTTKNVIWYLYASVIASLISFCISFVLRKLWVFQNYSKRNLQEQILFYTATLISVVGISMTLVFFQVEILDIAYLPAQFYAGVVSGLFGFVINSSITFKEKGNLFSEFFLKIKGFFK